MTRALLLCYNIHCVQRQQALSHQHNGLSACRECDLKMLIFSDCSPLLLNAEDFLFSEVKSKMANANVINEKAAVVAALVERLNGAQSGVIVDYSGLTVAEDTELRSAMRKEGVEYAVVKNTMMRRALDSVGLEALDEKLHGTTSLATGTEDPIAPIRLVADYSKKLGDKFNLKAACTHSWSALCWLLLPTCPPLWPLSPKRAKLLPSNYPAFQICFQISFLNYSIK